MCFSSLGFSGMRLSVACVFVGVIASLDGTFPSTTFCKAGFVDRY